MGYTLNLSFEIGQFEEWVNNFEYFALAGDVRWVDDDNEGSPVDWKAVAACRDQSLAWDLSERYDDEHDHMGVAGTRLDFEFPFFLNRMRSDWCYAIFDAVEAKDDDTGETVWYMKDELPVAITLTSRDASLVAQQIEEQGDVAIVEGCHPYPYQA